MRLTSSGITIVEGTAVLNGETDGMIRNNAETPFCTVKNVLHLYRLRNGNPIQSRDFRIQITGLRGKALDSKELPKELAIIGGGVIGIDLLHSLPAWE